MAAPLAEAVRRHLHDGTVIPAHPLALTAERKLDERRQRALTRYYLDAGAGGLAVAVHTTQFAIRQVGLLEPVLALAAEEASKRRGANPLALVAGVVGPTDQAVREAELARDMGYDLALLSPGGLGDWSEDRLLERASHVAEVLPVFGFYLQPAVGGRVLSYDFWRAFADIDGVAAIKIAPFDRYRTLDVVRAVAASAARASPSRCTPATTTPSWPTCSRPSTWWSTVGRCGAGSSAACWGSGPSGRMRPWGCSSA